MKREDIYSCIFLDRDSGATCAIVPGSHCIVSRVLVIGGSVRTDDTGHAYGVRRRVNQG